MRIPYNSIKDLHRILTNEELSGLKSRMRSKFCKLLEERDKERADEKNALLFELAKKDGSGAPIPKFIDGKPSFEFSVEDEEVIRQVSELLADDIVIDETEERRDMLLAVKEIVLNSGQMFSGHTASVYDSLCDIFEKLDYSEYGESK